MIKGADQPCLWRGRSRIVDKMAYSAGFGSAKWFVGLFGNRGPASIAMRRAASNPGVDCGVSTVLRQKSSMGLVLFYCVNWALVPSFGFGSALAQARQWPPTSSRATVIENPLRFDMSDFSSSKIGVDNSSIRPHRKHAR